MTHNLTIRLELKNNKPCYTLVDITDGDSPEDFVYRVSSRLASKVKDLSTTQTTYETWKNTTISSRTPDSDKKISQIHTYYLKKKQGFQVNIRKVIAFNTPSLFQKWIISDSSRWGPYFLELYAKSRIEYLEVMHCIAREYYRVNLDTKELQQNSDTIETETILSLLAKGIDNIVMSDYFNDNK